MAIHSGLSNLGNTDWNFNSFDLDPDISNDIQQTLTRLIGYNANYDKWLTVPVDAQGRILVSTAQVQGGSPSITSQNVLLATEKLLLSANPGRRAYIIYNNTGFTLNLYFVTGATVFLPIAAGTSYSDDIYLGAVYGQGATSALTVTIVEY